MILKRITPLSLAKIVGLIYMVIGLFVGLMLSLIGLLGLFASAIDSDGPGAFIGVLFGLGIIIAPIFYGILGFVMGLIAAALYNLFARLTGGVELDLQ
jgi:hypothetical protein